MASTASCGPVERLGAGDLGVRRRARDGVDEQALEDRHERRGQDAPAEAPAGHGVRLGEPVEDDGALLHALDREDGDVLALVHDARVDLVGQHDQVVRHGDRGDALDVGARQHRAGGVLRAVEDEQARARRDERAQLVEVQAEVALGRAAGWAPAWRP